VTPGIVQLGDPMTLTVTNSGGTCTGGTFSFGGGLPQPFARPAGAAGGTCGAALAAAAACTVNVVFSPKSAGPFSRTLTVSYTGVPAIPVTLTGTGVAQGTGHLSFTSATNGTLVTTPLFSTFTFAAPGTSVVTMTNTGTGPLYVTDEVLALSMGGLSITGTTCVNATPLAVNGTCTVSVTAPSFPGIGVMLVYNNGTGTNGLGASTLFLIAP